MLLLGGIALALVGGCVLAAWKQGAPLVPADAGRADGEGGWLTVFALCLAGAFAAYLGALALLGRARLSLRTALLVATAIQLVPLGAPLLLSTDAWTYWEYGALDNPYRDVPADVPGNPAYEYAGLAWRETTSVYGPAFTLGSKAVASLAGSDPDVAAWTYKALAAAAMLALTLLAARLARDRLRAAVLVGWNPLFAIHFAGGGHNDALMLALVLGALALAAGRRRALAGVGWALAILVKWVPVVFLALRALEARATGRRVDHRGLAFTAVGVGALATWQYGLDWLRAFGPLARNAEGQTSYAIPRRLEQLGLPHALALALAGLALVGGLVLLARASRRGAPVLGRAGCLLLLTTPWLAPWYAIWALPLAAAEDDPPAQLVALALCAYLLPQTVPL